MKAAKAEVASLAKRCYGAIMADLVNAFERVQHHTLLKQARRQFFPMRILRVLVLANRWKRQIQLDGILA